MKHLKLFEEELKGKMINVDYKIFHQTWDEKPIALITDYKIYKIIDNYVEIIAKGYRYGYLTNYGWETDFKNRKKKGWVPFNDLNKDRKVTIKVPKKSIQDGNKKIKVYFYENQTQNNKENIKYESFKNFPGTMNKEYMIKCSWCDKWFFEGEEEIKYDSEGDEICPYCNYTGSLMDLYFEDIGGEGFYDYIYENPPKIDITPEWRKKEPINFFKNAYPEWFEYKKYNL